MLNILFKIRSADLISFDTIDKKFKTPESTIYNSFLQIG